MYLFTTVLRIFQDDGGKICVKRSCDYFKENPAIDTNLDSLQSHLTVPLISVHFLRNVCSLTLQYIKNFTVFKMKTSLLLGSGFLLFYI
jgi:hypothetical protein